MKLKSEVLNLLQAQVKNELAAAHTYHQIALNLEDKAFHGSAAKFYALAEEERAHAKVFIDYLLQRGVRPKLPALGQPEGSKDPMTTSNPVGAFNMALNIEDRNLTDMLTILCVAKDLSDHVTEAFINGLIVEQQAEVAEMQDIITQLDDQMEKAALRQWDRDLK